MPTETAFGRRLRCPGVAAAVASLLFAGAVGAQEPLTLSAAMARGRSNAAQVRTAGLRVEASAAQREAARAHRLPRITVSEVWMRTDSPAEVFGLQLNQERFSFDDFVQADNWGAPRTHGELQKLGFDICETTVSRYMPRMTAKPDQLKRWVAFLRNHKDDIAATDFFTVPTASLRVLYC